MMIRFDLAATTPSTSKLIALYQADVQLDVGRKYIFNPKTQLFHLHANGNETREPGVLQADADVLFYLEVPGQNPTAKCPLANLNYQPIHRDEIAWF